MWVLAVDSATPHLGVALARVTEAGNLEALRFGEGEEGRGQHARRLPGLFLELLDAAGISLCDLGALVVGLGPGSFTGLRSGLATLKALSYGRDLPLLGESSLAGLALDAMHEASDRPEDLCLVPCFDARRAEVYASCHAATGQAIAPLPIETALAPRLLLEHLVGRSPRNTWIFGPGVSAFPELAKAPCCRPDLPSRATGRGLLEVALPRLLAGERDDPLTLLPRYARKSEAERQLAAGELKFR